MVLSSGVLSRFQPDYLVVVVLGRFRKILFFKSLDGFQTLFF